MINRIIKANSRFVFSSWVSETTFATGLPTTQIYCGFFIMDGVPSVIYCNLSMSTWESMQWNGSSWVSSSIHTGLGDYGSANQHQFFYIGSTLYGILGLSDGTFKGVVWGGSSWSSYSSIVSGLSDIGNNACLSVYHVNGVPKLMGSSRYYTMRGYSWSGSSWTLSSQVIGGIPTPTSEYTSVSVFYIGSDMYCILINDGGESGYKWNGSSWTANSDILLGYSYSTVKKYIWSLDYGGNIYLILKRSLSGSFTLFKSS